MYTQCPQCQTVFRVTATMLKAARGKVRCGRCAHVFNALTFLIDTEDQVEGTKGEPTAEVGEETLPTEQAAPAPPSGPQHRANQRPAMTGAPPAKAHAHAPPLKPLAERRFGDDTPLEELEALEEELVLEEEGETGRQDEIEVMEEGKEEGKGEDVDADSGELEGSETRDADADIPESALEFTATNLEQVFIEVPPPGVARTISTPESSNDATAEHEILDIELEQTPAPPEVITLEGDSVVIVEESGAKAEFHTGEYTELQEHNPPPPVEVEPAEVARVAKKPKTQEAIDAEVRQEIEKAFAADPTTRAEFVLPSGRRVSLHRNDDEVEVEEIEAATALERDTSKQRRTRIAWGVGGAMLALTLVLQVIHYQRQALVQTAVLGPILSRVYGALGSELSPPWDVKAFELRQWGAAADPDSGTLRVRASLLNGAAHAQPYPLLRLTLQDRFGESLRQRDLEPRDYLARPPANGQLLGAGQRVDADIVIVDPGADAENFEIDVCMRKQAAVACAHDALRQQG